MAYRPDCLQPSWACFLPWKLDEGRQKTEVGQWVCSPCSRRRGSKPCPAIGAGSSRPLFLKSPQGSRAAQPLQREMRGGWVVLEERKGLQRTTQTPGVTQVYPQAQRAQTPGTNHPASVRKKGPFCCPFPSEVQEPLQRNADTRACHLPLGKAGGLRQEGWLGAHRPLLLQALSLLS